MAFLVWKEQDGCYGWGCADCEFMIRNPRMRESLGEYVAAIRNQFDQHACAVPERQHTIRLVKKAALRSMGGRLIVRMRTFF